MASGAGRGGTDRTERRPCGRAEVSRAVSRRDAAAGPGAGSGSAKGDGDLAVPPGPDSGGGGGPVGPRGVADHAPTVLWAADAAVACTYLNGAWDAYTGQT